MKRCFILIGIISLFVLAGCASKSAAPPQEMVAQPGDLRPAPGKALVCYYNHKVFLGKTSVALNGQSSEIPPDTYVVWEVVPGAHLLTFKNRGVFVEKVSAEITCGADQTCYFYMTGRDPDTHAIERADAAADAEAKIAQFRLANRFVDGALATADLQPPVTPTPAPTPVPTTVSSETAEPHPTPAPETKAAPVTPGDVEMPTGAPYALVIGISQYQHRDALPTAAADAQAVAAVLQQRYGFQVQTLLDQQATRAGILGALNAFRDTLQPDDTLLIYYAGRGVREPDAQTAYWLPVEAEQDNDTQWIITDSMTAHLNRLPARQVLLVVDSCYTGILPRTTQPDLSGAADRRRYLAENADNRCRVLITTGATAPILPEENADMSLLAEAFIHALTEVDAGPITAQEIFTRYVREAVAGSSDSLPVFGVVRNSGHQGGDFIFRRLAP